MKNSWELKAMNEQSSQTNQELKLFSSLQRGPPWLGTGGGEEESTFMKE